MNIELSDLREVGVTLGGAIVGYILRMFGSEARIKNELSYIKGQLSQVLKMVEDVDSLKIKHVTLEKDHEKTRRDVDAAHLKLRGMGHFIEEVRLTIKEEEEYER